MTVAEAAAVLRQHQQRALITHAVRCVARGDDPEDVRAAVADYRSRLDLWRSSWLRRIEALAAMPASDLFH